MKNKIKLSIIFLLFVIQMNAQCDVKYGSIVISEVYFDTQYNEQIGAKFHSFGEYIELYNSSNEPVNLLGWTIGDNHTSFTFRDDGVNQNLIIEPGGYKIITFNGFYNFGRSVGGITINSGMSSLIGGRNKFIELFPEAIGHENDIILQNTMILDNDVDKVTLYNPHNKLINEVSYINGSGSNIYVNPTPLEFMEISSYTVNIVPPILNISEGYATPFNYPIGNIPDRDQLGEILYQSDGVTPVLVPRPDLKQAIYLTTNNNGYYSNHTALNYQVAIATPFSLPFSVPLQPIDPLLLYAPGYNNSVNSTESISYDIKTGFINGQSKTYFDDLGKSTVSLSKDFVTQYVWGSETVYDSFGRPFRQSFPAPSCFDMSKVDFLSNSTFKSLFLDNYYSNNNTIESYQATATQPYSEVEYDKLNPGNVIRSYGGNQVQTSPGVLEWKTGYTYTVPAAQEMYYLFGYNFYNGVLDTAVTPNKEEIQTKFYKTVGVDANGVENVVFTDGEGKVLASARSGASNIADYEVYSLIGTQGYVDVHIPSGTPDATFTPGTTAANYVVYDLKTGNVIPTPATLPSGNAYRIALAPGVTIPTSDPKVYVTNVATGGVLSTSAGAFGIKYKVNYYDYAINVYDKTNRLSRSIQPNGFKANFVATPSTFKILAAPTYLTNANFATIYTYNTLGQVVQVENKDEGTSKFAYRQDGQIRFSQNQLQSDTTVSYTNYDSFGRPIESGVIKDIAGMWLSAQGKVDSSIMVTGTATERTFSIYDYADNATTVSTTQIPTPYSMVIPAAQSLATLAPNLIQKNLAGNVAVTYKADATTINAITWYSYDLYGRLEWIAQYNDSFGNVVKTIDYEYDYKGNVSKVWYQKNNTTEQFIHRYTYDDNGTLTDVETSVDNTNFTTHANYTYYKTGELKRLNLVQPRQGLDYVYTLGGMLKSINHPSLEQAKDPGGDSNDLFGITLDYYNGDYIRSGTNITTSPSITGLNQDNYNGNIKAARFANKPIDFTSGTTANQNAYTYNYNRNNWLTKARFSPTDNSGVINVGNIAKKKNFYEGDITYDPNGNIVTLQRTDETNTGADATVMDNLTYNYTTAGTNRLRDVRDTANSTISTVDIDNQAAGNYGYNAIGQMTTNAQESLTYAYNTSGLVIQVNKGIRPLVRFFYNERGQRIKKESYDPTGNGTLQSTTYYVLDLSGNVMSNYYKSNLPIGPITQTELPIYGASRLGVFSKGPERASYEITDHLGNVRAVVFKMLGGAAPSVSSYADYYPFGEKLPNRILNSSPPYKYAFQGQELDTETGMEAFQLRLWDGRIGRWLSPDPKGQYASPYLGMGNNPVSSVDPDGGFVYPDGDGSYYGQAHKDSDGSWIWTGNMWEGQKGSISILAEVGISKGAGFFAHSMNGVSNNNTWMFNGYNFGFNFGDDQTFIKSKISGFNAEFKNESSGLYLKGSAEVTGLKGNLSGRFGNTWNAIEASVDGSVYGAFAEGNYGVMTGQENKYGAGVGASAGAYVAKGGGSIALTVLGIKVKGSAALSFESVHAGGNLNLYYDTKSGAIIVDVSSNLGLEVGAFLGSRVEVPIGRWIDYIRYY